MIVSFNEVEGTVLKAARGAGFTWGAAEDIAHAARWMAARDDAWSGSLASLLTAHTVHRASPESPLCPLTIGLTVGDMLAPDAPLTFARVAAPVWLLPFAARRTSAGWTVCVDVDGKRTYVRDDIIAGERPAGAIGRDVRIAMSGAPSDLQPEPARPANRRMRATVDPESWKVLQALEARTYVPVSDHSRIAGAGAGLSDND